MTSSNGNNFRVTGSFVRRIRRPPVNSPHKGQWRGALMFSFICVWINGRVNNHEAGHLRRYRTHYDVTVMWINVSFIVFLQCFKQVIWFWWYPFLHVKTNELSMFCSICMSECVHLYSNSPGKAWTKPDMTVSMWHLILPNKHTFRRSAKSL